MELCRLEVFLREPGAIMPTYQYVCDDCFEPYEVFLKLADKDKYDNAVKKGKHKGLVVCPECGADLRGLICPVMFHIEV